MAEQDKDKNRKNNVQQYITWDQNPLTTMMYLTIYMTQMLYLYAYQRKVDVNCTNMIAEKYN